MGKSYLCAMQTVLHLFPQLMEAGRCGSPGPPVACSAERRGLESGSATAPTPCLSSAARTATGRTTSGAPAKSSSPARSTAPGRSGVPGALAPSPAASSARGWWRAAVTSPSRPTTAAGCVPETRWRWWPATTSTWPWSRRTTSRTPSTFVQVIVITNSSSYSTTSLFWLFL